MRWSNPRSTYPTSKADTVLIKAKDLAIGDILSTGETVTNVNNYAKLEYVQVQLDRSNDLIQYDKKSLIHIKS